jgi:hypothetical protein
MVFLLSIIFILPCFRRRHADYFRFRISFSPLIDAAFGFSHAMLPLRCHCHCFRLLPPLMPPLMPLIFRHYFRLLSCCHFAAISLYDYFRHIFLLSFLLMPPRFRYFRRSDCHADFRAQRCHFDFHAAITAPLHRHTPFLHVSPPLFTAAISFHAMPPPPRSAATR